MKLRPDGTGLGDEVPPNLANNAVRGAAWMGFATGAQVVLQLIVLALLSRLVSPAEFGVVSIGVLAIQLGQLLAESSIGPALIQRKRIDESHIRVGFTFALLLAFALWGILAASSGWIAKFFNAPGAARILQVVGVVFVIRNLTVGDFLMSRRMRFRPLALVELCSYGLGYGVVAVGFAWRGAGPWAIVAGQIGQAAVQTILVWLLEPHTVKPSLSPGPLKSLLSYGGGQFLGRLANYSGNQGDNLVVAKFLGPAALGLYSRAYQMMRLPSNLFGQAAGEVLFPAMAKVQDDIKRLSRAYLTSVGTIGLVALPASVLAAVLSDELVSVLLGPHWLRASPAFRMMALGILFSASSKLSDSLARATGHVYRRAWRQFAYAAAIVLAAIAGRNFGITGVAVGVLLVNIGNFLLMAHLSLSITGSRAAELMFAHIPAAILALAVALSAGPAAHLLRSARVPDFVVLVGSAAAAGFAVLVTARMGPRLRLTRPLGEAFAALVRVVGAGFPGVLLHRVLGSAYAERLYPGAEEL
jgi:O-antigen/teichoic acid export membrane protein